MAGPAPARDERRDPVDAVWRRALPTVAEVDAARARLHRKALVIAVLLATSYILLVVADSAPLVRIVAGAQHNGLHHGNTNVVGFDADIELGPWARVAPSQPWRPRYRYQHVYMWPLYGFLALKNLFVSDLLTLVNRRIGAQPLRRQVTRGALAGIAAGKLLHVGWALAVPLLFNPWPAVFAVYFLCSWLVGLFLAVLFQLAHCVEATNMTDRDVPRRGEDRAAHQLRTTFDVVSPPHLAGRAFRWLAGGLDHQVEHHLAPGLPHTVYAEVAPRFRTACLEQGIEHRQHPGLGAALASHARWLRAMGAPPAPSS